MLKTALFGALIVLWAPHQSVTAVTPDVPEDNGAAVEGGKVAEDTGGWSISDAIKGLAEPVDAIKKQADKALPVQSPESDLGSIGKSTAPPPVCSWVRADPTTESHEIPIPYDLSKGHVEKKVCGAPAGDTTGMGSAVVGWNFVADGTPAAAQAAAPVVDVQALARQAYEELKVPTPRIQVGPDRSTVAVQLPTWLWVDDPGALTAVVSTGGVTVTANAVLRSTEWSLGEPARNQDFTGYRSGPAVTMTCAGAGTPPPASADWNTEPTCGHTFRWRSLPERTGGAGAWPLSATTTWDVTWTATTGQSGQIQLTSTGTDALPVTEYRILLTAGG